MLGDSCFDLDENRNFYAHEINFHFLPESDKIPLPLAVDQYTNFSSRPNVSEFLELHKYSRVTDTTDYFVFDRFCFLCVVCLF